MNDQQSVPPTQPSPNYAVMLPCSPDAFADFIGSLLGRPQTIERMLVGNVSLDRAIVVNLFHLVDQRVKQNQAALMQFTAKIVYSDNSSVLLNSLLDFEHYNEVHPKVSVALHLSWTYLVNFQGRSAPEKQVIELSFGGPHERYGIRGGMDYLDDFSLADLRIAHTERTWGIDIESLLVGNLKIFVLDPTKFEMFMRRHNDNVATAIWGCAGFCVNGVSLTRFHPLFKLDRKAVQCGFPVPDGHRPFLADVA